MDYHISSPSPHPLSTLTSFINPPTHPISTYNVPHNPSLVRSITSISSPQFSIYISIANNFSYTGLWSAEPFFVHRTPSSVRTTPLSSARPAIFPFSYLQLQNEEHLPAEVFHPPDNHLKAKRKPPSDPSTPSHLDTHNVRI